MATDTIKPRRWRHGPIVRRVVNEHVAQVPAKDARGQAARNIETGADDRRKENCEYHDEADEWRRPDISTGLSVMRVVDLTKNRHMMVNPSVDHVFDACPSCESETAIDEPF